MVRQSENACTGGPVLQGMVSCPLVFAWRAVASCVLQIDVPVLVGTVPLGVRSLLCICMIAAVLLAMSSSNVAAQSCRKVTASSDYPMQAASNEQVQVTTTIAGSCSSGPEDYFSVRVDITDPVSKALLSSGTAPIGYSITNFTVRVQNSVLTPADNRTWLIEINSYLFIDAQIAHSNSTTGTIQVGGTPVPEFRPDHTLVLLLALTATLSLHRRRLHKKRF